MVDNSTLIIGPTVHIENESLPEAAVWIEDDKIKQIFSGIPPIDIPALRLYFPSEYHLIPGRIDLHIHGLQGFDIMDATSEALEHICLGITKEGTTGFLATTLTAMPDEIEKAVLNVKNNAYIKGAEILGIHLEGPFISPQFCGAHQRALVLLPNIELFNYWQSCAGNQIKLVSIAPELGQSMDFIRHAANQGVIVAIGHSGATFVEAQAAINAGAHYGTHLFNAMRQFHHREPGASTAILLDQRVTAELIADGLHLHPATINLAWKIKTKDNLVLVTDSMRAKCCKEEISELGGQAVFIKEGAVRLADGTLAGSILTMEQAVKNLLKYTSCSLADIIAVTSVNPAKLLNLWHKKGSVSPGKDADLVVLDENFSVQATFCRGQQVFSSSLS